MIKVSIQPKIGLSEYGEETFIEDFVLPSSKINQSIFGSGGGLYNSKTNSLSVRIDNEDKKFSLDSQLFSFSRNQAKLRLFHNDNLIFYGIIDERQTSEDLNNQLITLKALSVDFLTKKSKVPENFLYVGQNVIDAIVSLIFYSTTITLTSEITSNLKITKSEGLANSSIADIVGKLSFSAGGIIVFDKDKIYLKQLLKPKFSSYHTVFNKKISQIKNLTEGYNQIINYIRINDQNYIDDKSLKFYGEYSTDLSVSYLGGQEATISDNILNIFKYAKKNVTIIAEINPNYNLLDLIRIDYQNKLGNVWGIAKYGDTWGKSYPVTGKYTIIGIKTDFKKETMELLLREQENNELAASGKIEVSDLNISNTWGSAIWEYSKYN